MGCMVRTVSLNNDSLINEVTDHPDILTISEDTLTHTSSVVNGLGDTLFLEVNDSVLTDKMAAPPATNH